MSNDIKDIDGKKLHINTGIGMLMIGDSCVSYSELLPVIQHYIQGGLFGHCDFTPPEQLEAIREFIKNVSNLEERRVRVLDNQFNTVFVDKTTISSKQEGGSHFSLCSPKET